jgi:hypothetical protein
MDIYQLMMREHLQAQAAAASQPTIPPEIRALNQEDREWLIRNLKIGVKNMCASGRTEMLGVYRQAIKNLEACG